MGFFFWCKSVFRTFLLRLGSLRVKVLVLFFLLVDFFTDDLHWTFLSDWLTAGALFFFFFLFYFLRLLLSLLRIFTRLQTLQRMEAIDCVSFKCMLCGWSCLFTAGESSAARAEWSLVFRWALEEVEATCGREQRSFSFLHVCHWLCTPFALIYCPLTKTCDYTPFFSCPAPLCKKLLFLIRYKSHNWAFFKGRCGCVGTLPIRVRSVKCNLPLLFSSASHPWYTVLTPLHIPSRVTRITSFSPNGHFGWQVHYTLYFQIVCPLLMPGRLIALAASPRKGLTSAAAARWKTVITVFL